MPLTTNKSLFMIIVFSIFYCLSGISYGINEMQNVLSKDLILSTHGKKILIVGNWKMNLTTIKEAVNLAKELDKEVLPYQNISEVIIGVPYTAIKEVAKNLSNSAIKISAQDLFWEDVGAFTGAISAPILKDAGATHVIIGHPDRRGLFHETDEMINKKLKAALRNNLIPILCFGETMAEWRAGKTDKIIRNQMKIGLTDISGNDIEKIIMVYDPIWLLHPDTDKAAFKKQAEVVQLLIRQVLAKKFGGDVADKVKILYTGGVKADNVKEILNKPNVDGVLVGSASLKVKDFMGIIINASSHNK